MKLRNNNILIFGGGSGIGKAIAIRLVKAGVKVLIVGRREEKLMSVAKEINSPNLYYKVFDITDIKGHLTFFDECCEILGSLDGFVNAAAIGTETFTGRGYEPWDITEQEWDKLTDINFKFAFFLIRNEVDYMLKKEIRGNILNIASMPPVWILLVVMVHQKKR